MRTVREWWRAHDPNGAALRRSARTAIVMPSLFALCFVVLDNLVLATFAAFGSFAMLLLTEFSGPLRDRVAAQVSLAVTGCLLVCVGTLLAQPVWLAVLGMLVVGFVIQFAGVVSSSLAAATPCLLLSFVLPLTLAGDAASIPDRLGSIARPPTRADWGCASRGPSTTWTRCGVFRARSPRRRRRPPGSRAAPA